MSSQPAAILVLEDGRVFRGRSFGAAGETFGELVFSTGMSGYQELLTDPSYHRQVVLTTAPHVGNTGWNDEDDESSRIWVAGFVVRDPAPRPSNWRSRGSLDAELARQGIVGIADVDTRAITRHIREAGAMRVGISTQDLDEKSLLAKVLQQPSMKGADLTGEVTISEPYVIPAKGEKVYTVAVLDLGIKSMSLERLSELGIEQHVLPATATWDDVAAIGPDGVFFSNGPGDPAAATGPISLLQEALANRVPYFGICLGNQLFGHALGLRTYKLKFGHRGLNQPVKELATGKVEITAQNHGFAVDAPIGEDVATPYGTARVSHICLNDDVVEGLELRRDGRLAAFSVQYHPEAAAGPHDSTHLFDRFVEMLANAGKEA
ncbi:glutamine-hydrolyzing carbamoyl-phosphate synthase small subunit [Tessaracoccus sp. OS52]|uniref:glutamine-hydrolyzing carbamoyl-phosphate synthase small subunit n=1 Tax=Tessaracoccus sp. OS52 TaxID=2886691 RepID=UPI001D12E631|nr:glutamine-hydrolyzing carbamoyl-phosphate synthase small subunit [Tessaracoccus sp. OS52]MCC2592962.1 glutamine-hydrolyzing carbamoyl-phosphate synthase small subunit [Tessaracoccus sp. OS52]